MYTSVVIISVSSISDSSIYVVFAFHHLLLHKPQSRSLINGNSLIWILCRWVGACLRGLCERKYWVMMCKAAQKCQLWPWWPPETTWSREKFMGRYIAQTHSHQRNKHHCCPFLDWRCSCCKVLKQGQQVRFLNTCESVSPRMHHNPIALGSSRQLIWSQKNWRWKSCLRLFSAVRTWANSLSFSSSIFHQ